MSELPKMTAKEVDAVMSEAIALLLRHDCIRPEVTVADLNRAKTKAVAAFFEGTSR